MNRDDAFRLINAYVDDELDVKEALEVQAMLEQDEALREEYRRLFALKAALRQKLEEEGPVASDLLRKRVGKAFRREGLRENRWFRATASVAAALVALFLGWGAYNRAMAIPAPLVSDTMMVYEIEIGNPLDIRSGDLRTISTWLAEKLQGEVKTLNLKGAEVIGARLCPFTGQKGVFIRYRMGGKNVALLISKSSGMPYSLPMISSFQIEGQPYYQTEKDSFRMAYWKQGMWFYSLVVEGATPGDDLKSLLTQSTFEF